MPLMVTQCYVYIVIVVMLVRDMQVTALCWGHQVKNSLPDITAAAVVAVDVVVVAAAATVAAVVAPTLSVWRQPANLNHGGP